MAHPMLAAKDAWFTKGASAESVAKNSITEISVVDSYIPSAGAKSWDGSDGNGGVTVYVEGSKLTIAGNGSGCVYANPNSENIFNGFTKMISFESGALDTSKATTLKKAFYDCTEITHLDLTSWNVEMVKDLQAAFNGMLKVETLLVHNWNTIRLEVARTTFQACVSLEVLDLSGWDFSNILNLIGTFSGVANYGGPMKLKTIIGIENKDVRKVKSMASCFCLNGAMERIDLSGWNNADCTETNKVFADMTALKEIVLGKNFEFRGTTPYISAPSGDGADGYWYDLSGNQCGTTSLPTGVTAAYYASLASVEDYRNMDVLLKNKTLIDTAEAIRTKNGTGDQIIPSNFSDAICCPTISAAFLSVVKKATSVEKIQFTTHYDGPYTVSWAADDMRSGAIMGYLNDKTVIISSNGQATIRVAANASNLFSDLPLLKSIAGMEMLDVSCVRFFDRAFSDCSSLVEIDLSRLNFSQNLVSYDGLFEGAYRLEKATLWERIKFVSARMFFSCIALEEIYGLSAVAEIRESAFVNAVNLVSADIDVNKVAAVGNDAFRRSNIEDVVDFTQLSSTASVGIRATRSQRWDGSDLAEIRNFFAGKSYSDVLIDVPNSENQYIYPHIKVGTYGDYGPIYMATWGCGYLTTYHEWNAVHNRHGEKDKVYPDFQTWWDEVILAKHPNYAEENDPSNTSTTKAVPGAIRQILGWTSAAMEFAQSADQLQTIADRLAAGFPMYATTYTTGVSLTGTHAVLIVGMKPSEGKIAILDSSVVGHTGVVMWLRYEDLFVKKGWDADKDAYHGVDRLQVVMDYNL